MDKNNTPQRKKYPPPFSMRFTTDERKKLDIAADGLPLAAYTKIANLPG